MSEPRAAFLPRRGMADDEVAEVATPGEGADPEVGVTAPADGGEVDDSGGAASPESSRKDDHGGGDDVASTLAPAAMPKRDSPTRQP